MKLKILVLLTSLFLIAFLSKAQLTIDVEAGIVKTGYNDVRIPGDLGTFISFSDELTGKNAFFSRARVGYRFGARNEALALYAPLALTYNGSVDRDIVFQGETFLAGRQLNATYKFNSYRLTYRYYFLANENIDFAAGLTVKVRDAVIGIESEQGQYAAKTDIGLVPIINFYLHWKPTDRFGLLLDGDALAAPQGRAEDVLIAATYRFTESFSIKAGYRLLEGGADNATVYTFSLFHYGVLGVIIQLK